MRTTLSVSAALAAIAALAFAGPAAAKTYEVTRTSDPNPGACKPRDCSLREAVLAANTRPGADAIVLPARRYRLTRANPGGASEDLGDFGDLDLNTDPLSLTHPGRGMARIDANELDRVLHVQPGAATTLKRIGIVDGVTDENGGGILTRDRLRLVRSAVRGNTAAFDGGGIDAQDESPIAFIQSTVAGNDSGDDGGGLNGGEGDIVARRSRITGNEADEAGGGIRTTEAASDVEVSRSTIAGNTGEVGGGIEIESTSFVMLKSTVTRNRALLSGGGLHSAELTEITINSSTIDHNRANGPTGTGGGVYLDGPTALITNSTVEGNRANARGGGIHAQDGADLTLNAVTVTRNVAAADDDGLILLAGGGLSRISSAGFDVRNSLIALNKLGAAQSIRNDCAGDTPFDSLGNNLLSSPVVGANCEGFDEPTDLVRANPKIEPLRQNGGPTKTVALKAGSAAIGHAHKPSAPDRDQRGRRRDNNPDSGAFERGA